MPKRSRNDDVIDVTPPRKKVKADKDVINVDDVDDEVEILPILDPKIPKSPKKPKTPATTKAAKPAEAPKAAQPAKPGPSATLLKKVQKDAQKLWKTADQVTFNKRKSKLKFFLKDAELEGIPFTKSRILLHFGYGWQYEYMAKDLKAAIGSEAALTVRTV